MTLEKGLVLYCRGFKGPTGTFRFFAVMINITVEHFEQESAGWGERSIGKLNRHFRLNARVGGEQR